MIFATRTLKVRRSGQPDAAVPIRLFAPEQAPNAAWGCRIEIDWPGRQQELTAWSFDAVQALEMATQMIGANLHTSSYHEAGELMFDRPGSGYGFPVPATLRDLLIGDDAEAYG